MKRAILIALMMGIGAFGLMTLWNRVRADEPKPKESGRPLEEQVQALRDEVVKLAQACEALKGDLEKLKTAFERHSHPVKFWDAEKKAATAWTEVGSFFIAYPKVGQGDSDADAAAAGGTWGTP